MTSAKLLSILRDFTPEYHHAKFGGNWITNKGKQSLYFTNNNKKRSHTQLDSRKQVIAFQDRVITINI